MCKSTKTYISGVVSFLVAGLACASVTTEFVLDDSNAEVRTVGLLPSTLGITGMPLESGSYDYSYVTQFFTPTTSGEYTFGQSSGDVDSVMILFEGSFDPDNPGSNYLGFNDDSGNSDVCGSLVGRCPVLTMDLDADVDYHLVISTYRPTPEQFLNLPLEFFITGSAPVGVGGPASGIFVPVSDRISYGVAYELDYPPDGISEELSEARLEMAARSSAERALTLRRIIPLTNSALLRGATNTINGGMDIVASRLQVLREQDFSVAGKNTKPLMLASYGPFSLGPHTQPRQWGNWLKGFRASGKQRSDNGFSGYKDRYRGVAFGMDTALFDGLVFGAAFSYGEAAITLNEPRQGDLLNVASFQSTLYMTGHYKRLYLDSMYSYVQQRFHTVRDTTVSGTAEAKFRGIHHAGRMNLGLLMPLNRYIAFTPIVGVNANQIYMDAYHETGAGPLSLNVNRASYLRGSVMAAGKLIAELHTTNGYILRPSLHVTRHRELNEGGISLSATFEGGGNAFTTPGQALPRNVINYGITLSLFKNIEQQLTLQYDEIESDEYTAQAAQIQWQSLF